ncbi:universal stress protein [Demequina subtropica]|uniref:universal stress protein n=1 Tax=Demequina subtropica TaxID=1638989 RepID=UPI0007838405|nr:universal stress protein [Demequina subtropica]
MDAWPLIAAAVWVGTGVITGAWMVRRGHDRRWIVVAIALGPLFVPMALERVERTPRVADASPDGPPASRDASPGLRVLVGVDGSPEAERALELAMAAMGDRCGQVVLAEVVGYDATDPEEPEDMEAASAHLERARALAPDAPVNIEVLAGPPGEALLRCAADNDVDLLVVGRRGHGLSRRVLGTVSDHLVHHSDVPVLVVEPRHGVGRAVPSPRVR